jgi:ComF family protein
MADRSARCGDCLRDPPPFARTVCAVDYAFPWDALIQALKYDGQPELAAPLAGLLVSALRRGEAPAVDLVLPVPLAPARRQARGYNQAWELARRAARALHRPARADLLQRVLDTPAQAVLDRRERQHNLRAAYWVPAAAAAVLRGRHLALVDDVLTTGATLREAAAALQRAGAASVQAWVVARTP